MAEDTRPSDDMSEAGESRPEGEAAGEGTEETTPSTAAAPQPASSGEAKKAPAKKAAPADKPATSAGTAPGSKAPTQEDAIVPPHVGGDTVAARLAGRRALLPVVDAAPAGGHGVEMGMFGAHGTGDTSGYGGLVRRPRPVLATPAPWGGWFDAAWTALAAAYPERDDAVEAVVVEHGEMTIHVKREHLVGFMLALRNSDGLKFELLSGVSGVDYPDDTSGRRLHSVYQLLSLTYRRPLRVEVSVGDDDPHVPSVMDVYPTADWHERETYDMFGIVYDGHHSLTRILMPDDWVGHPQRKDYPLGGIPVEYKGAQVPAPDERRSYA
jgi:NADH-quinone oxidoreductase subunit C